MITSHLIRWKPLPAIVLVALVLMLLPAEIASARNSRDVALPKSRETLTPPCPPTPGRWRLATDETTLFVVNEAYQAHNVYESTDFGATWRHVFTDEDLAAVPSHVWLQFERSPTSFQCDPHNPDVCFRTNLWSVEETDGNGRPQRVVWKMSRPRREFLNMWWARRAGETGCVQEIDTSISDMAVLSDRDATILVVAVGNAGVHIRAADGAWNWHFDRISLPLEGTPSWSDLLLFLLPEIDAFLLLMVAVWSIMSRRCWSILKSDAHASWSDSAYKEAVSRYLWSLGVMAVPLIVLAMAWMQYDRTYYTWLLLLLLASLLLLIGSAVAFWLVSDGWGRMASACPDQNRMRKMKRTTFLTSVMVGAGWSVFLIWSSTAAFSYWLAILVAAILVIAALTWGEQRIRRLSSAK